MRIKEVKQVIDGAKYIQSCPLGIMWFRGEATELNGVEISSKELFLNAGFREGIFASMSPNGDIYEITSNGIKLQISADKTVGYPTIGNLPSYYIASNWDKDHGGNIYKYIQNGEILWSKLSPYTRIGLLGDYALLWYALGSRESSCQLIDLSTGTVLWEIDYPGAFIKQVFPYADKVVIVWFTPLGPESKDRVLCVEIPSGKVLWENNTARNYHKYGEDKLVCFLSFYRDEGEEDDNNHSYAEIDVRTGAVYIHKYPGYRSSVERNYVYKDFLFYTAARGDAYIGAINLRTHEMIDEVMIDFVPGEFNQTKGIGIYGGQLYVEVQTELDHSDIHVFDLEEDDCLISLSD